MLRTGKVHRRHYELLAHALARKIIVHLCMIDDKFVCAGPGVCHFPRLHTFTHGCKRALFAIVCLFNVHGPNIIDSAYLRPDREMKKMTRPSTTATAINPVHTPALKIPPMSSQLLSVNANTTSNRYDAFFIHMVLKG